ncbi:DUF4286 family protein [Cognatilysobacter bugurensis]|uniref:DUF4286 family protein n=1 Tax=Cognatilysobacter bugurensis TaxID=543356 RepID=A0A918T1T1_9GAMM|nr:DUF4286 family protein [Lysobacter bugurensis]GHA82506.1 hypothetical protein GCM10007067_20600 [Lysobacter bugurensis]
MLIYEVNVDVDAEIHAAYLAWLRPHIDEILALPGFTGAQMFEVTEPAPSEGQRSLCVQYRLVDAAALDAYLREHAPRLRADGVARFGTRFRAQRRVMQTLER